MAWEDELLEASFRGVVFDCTRTRDRAPRDLARDAYPYVDGEDVQDLGAGAREIQLTAVFFGDEYKAGLDRLLDALQQRGAGELIHPVWGSIPNAQVVEWEVLHDAESPDYCTVELQFVRATPGKPFFDTFTPEHRADAAVQNAEQARTAGTELFAKAVDGVRALKGAYGRLNALRGVLSGTLAPLYSAVTGFTRTTLDFVNFPRAFAADLVGLISGMADLRGFDTGVIFSDWKSLLGQFGDVVKLPQQSSASLSTIGSSGVPHAGDVAKVNALAQLVATTELASVASDLLVAEVEAPSMEHAEIEQLVADVRTAIVATMEQHRAIYPIEQSRPITEPLKSVALALQVLAIEAIEKRPPLVERTVEAPGNLALIAHRWYADHTRSAELLRLNPGIRNPNFIERGEVLRAYSV